MAEIVASGKGQDLRRRQSSHDLPSGAKWPYSARGWPQLHLPPTAHRCSSRSQGGFANPCYTEILVPPINNMKKYPLLIFTLALACLTANAHGQSGTLDQVSPFGSAAPYGGVASFNFDASFLVWQAEVIAGMDGTLEGFQMEVTGPLGASANFAIHLGSPWQAGTPAWSGTVAKTTAGTEIIWIDVSSANISLSTGDAYTIEAFGNSNGMWVTGSYEAPVNTLYTPDLFINSSLYGPEWKIGFHTYMLGTVGFTLSITGTCPGSMAISVSGASVNGSVALAYGNAGSWTIPNGPCAGTVLDLAGVPTLAGFFNADAVGTLILAPNVPAGLCGKTLQAVDMTTCTVSNPVIL